MELIKLNEKEFGCLDDFLPNDNFAGPFQIRKLIENYLDQKMKMIFSGFEIHAVKENDQLKSILLKVYHRFISNKIFLSN